MEISRIALAELEQKTLALRQPGDRITAFTDSSVLSGCVMLGLLIDSNFVAIAIPRADYRAGELCKILGFEDPFDPNTTHKQPAPSAYARAVQQRLQPPQPSPSPQAQQKNVKPQPPQVAEMRPRPPTSHLPPARSFEDTDLEIAGPDLTWPDHPSIPFENALTPLRGDEWDESPALTHHGPAASQSPATSASHRP